jgi:hypothetical protein
MEYLSLYDYLGKAAGEKLGFEVKQEADKQEILTQTREISNPKYTGTVHLYPKDFLEFYFREPESYQIEDDMPGTIEWSGYQLIDGDLPKGHDWTGNLEDDDLPF